jgi:hypothetical protein
LWRGGFWGGVGNSMSKIRVEDGLWMRITVLLDLTWVTSMMDSSSSLSGSVS